MNTSAEDQPAPTRKAGQGIVSKTRSARLVEGVAQRIVANAFHETLAGSKLELGSLEAQVEYTAAADKAIRAASCGGNKTAVELLASSFADELSGEKDALAAMDEDERDEYAYAATVAISRLQAAMRVPMSYKIDEDTGGRGHILKEPYIRKEGHPSVTPSTVEPGSYIKPEDRAMMLVAKLGWPESALSTKERGEKVPVREAVAYCLRCWVIGAPLSYPEIADAFGKRQHSTILEMVRRTCDAPGATRYYVNVLVAYIKGLGIGHFDETLACRMSDRAKMKAKHESQARWVVCSGTETEGKVTA